MSYPAVEHLKMVYKDALQFALEQVVKFSSAALTAIEEVEAAKADKFNAVSVTIPTAGWTSDTSVSAYPYYYDISVTGITTNDRADIIIAQTSLAAAKSCGLCATSVTLAGKIRIRATAKPTSSISVQYTVVKGKEA